MKKRTWIKLVVWVIGIMLILLTAGNFILKSAVEKKLRASLQQLQPYVQAGFSKVHINLFAASVTLDSVYVQYDPELKHQHWHTLRFSSAAISDIHFFKLIVHKDFSAGSLALKNTDIQLDHYLLTHNTTIPDSFLKRTQLPFKNVSLNNIEIKNAKFSQRNDTKLSTICTGSISLKDVFMPAIDVAFTKDNIRFENVVCDLEDINYQLQGYYSVQLKKFHINSQDSVVQLDSLKLISKLGKYEMEQKLGGQVDHINASVKNIEISGVDMARLLQKKFIAKQISVNNVDAYIFRDERLPQSNEKQTMPLDYLQQIPYELNVHRFDLNNATIELDHSLIHRDDTSSGGFLKKIQFPFKNVSFDNIGINNAKILQRDNAKLSTVCTGSILLNGVFIPAIDTAFTKDSIRVENIVCDLQDVNYPLSGYYSVQLNKFHINSRDSMIELDALKLIPELGKYEMGQKLGKQVDHINAFVKNIEVSGLDVTQLIQKKFIAKQISINNADAYVFRDRRLPRSKEKQPMPLDYLKQIPFEMDVGRFDLNNATITSEEFPKKGDHTGYIKLENVNITMKPLKNYATKTNSSINSFVKASIMGAGNIEANINLSMTNGNSHIKGAIDELHLTAMNPSAENLGKFHIESGVLNRLDFEFTATNTKASGQIVGAYHDLVIDRLKLTKNGLKKASTPSFLLHKIIIPKNKDISLNVKHRTGKIDFERDPTRIVTFYYLKALLDGIRDSFTLGFVLPS